VEICKSILGEIQRRRDREIKIQNKKKSKTRDPILLEINSF